MKKILLTTFLSFALLCSAYGQTADITPHNILINPPLLNECGTSDTINISLQNISSNPTDVFMNIVLTVVGPNKLILDSAIVNSEVSGFTRVADDTLLININDISQGASRDIDFLLKAKCGAGSSGAQQCEYSVSYTINAVPVTYAETGTDLATGTRKPSIQLAPIGTINHINTVFGDLYTRTWKITNTGIKSRLDSFYFRSFYESELSFEKLEVKIKNGAVNTVTPAITSGVRDSISYKIVATLDELLTNPGDTIIVTETFRIVGCTDQLGTEQSTVSVFWGCYNDPVCELNSVFANTTTFVGVPVIEHSMRKVSPAGMGCLFGNPVSYEVALWNRGTGAATRISLNFQQLDAAYIQGSIEYRHKDSMTWKALTATSLSAANTWNTARRCSPSVWPAANDKRYIYFNNVLPSIAAGDTMYIRFQTQVCCPTQCQNSIVTASSISGSYGRLCGSTRYNTGSIQTPNSGQVRLEMREAGYVTDLENGDSSQIGFSHADYTFQDISDDKFRYIKMDLEMPIGLLPHRDTGDLIGSTSDYIEYNASTNTATIVERDENVIYNNISRRFSRFRYIFDCSIPGVKPGLNYLRFRIRASLSDTCTNFCEISRCWDSIPIYLHCPGLSAGSCGGGMVNSGLFAGRTNFGIGDNNNDRIPDGTIDTTRIARHRLDVGDTFRISSNGVVKMGTNPVPATFRYGYMENNLSNDGHGDFFTPLNANIWIKDASTGLSYTCGNLDIYGGGTNSVIVDYSVDSLISAGCLPTGFEFEDGDSVKVNLVMHYSKFNNSYGSNSTAFVEYETFLTNIVYLSDTDRGAVGHSKYHCDEYHKKFFMYDIRQYSYQGGTLNCGEARINFHNEFKQGYLEEPNEYKLNQFIDSMSIFLPARLNVDSMLLRIRTRSASTFTYIKLYPPFNVVNDTLKFNFLEYYRNFGGTGTIWSDDYGTYSDITMYIKPSCDIGTFRFNVKRYYQVYTLDTSFVISQSPLLSFDGNGYDLGLSMSGPVTNTANDKVAEWDVQIDNQSAGRVLPNVWLGYKSFNGTIRVDSIRNLSNNNLLVRNNDIWHFGSLGPLGSRNYKIYASYDACTPDSIEFYSSWNCGGILDSLSAATCDRDTIKGFLTTLQPELQIINTDRPNGPISLCDTFSYEFKVGQVDPAASYDNIFRINLPANSSIRPDSTYVQFPDSLGSKIYINFQDLGGGSWGFNVDTIVAQIKANGLRPVAEYPNNTYRVGFKAFADCGFVSGDAFQGQADGVEACGQKITTVFDNSEVEIDNVASAATRIYVPRIDSVGVNGCGTPTNTKLSLFNFSGGPVTTVNDRFYLILPIGVTYVNGSSSFSNNAFSPAEPTVNSTVFPGKQRLEWNMLPGIATNDSSVWTININTNPALLNCGNLEFEAQTLTVFPDTCGTTVCNVGKLSRKTNEPMFMNKAIINLIAGTSIEIRRDTGNSLTTLDTLVTNIFYVNNGNIASEKVKLYYFQDANNNGKWDVGESTIVVDSFTNVASGSMINMSRRYPKPYNSLTCGLGLLQVNTCDCQSDTISTPLSCNIFALPVELLGFNVRNKRNLIAELKWSTSSEYNTSHFEIYRSIDGISYKNVGRIDAKGNNNTLSKYLAIDDISLITSKSIYYKLKVVDNNGSAEWTYIQSIQKDDILQGLISISPNPASNDLTLLVNNMPNGKYPFVMVDATGKVVLQNSILISDGVGEKKQNIRRLASGVYTIVLNGHSQKLVIRK